ncbi:UDP-glucose 4-epimerase GalE [bacterium (Candidatus Blackallbacteria) CG17_big_fil_post_rev_8_21_14_2_50_48_46]|uniref:UDP-glucose 4-epimerase n=1 Tax=bacterium (Candidatus Blackallbacteria) CG17_big_fil_post_rev_8_21_14_2_50_48_46 TaxID=2014261 RepID=A0A2M7G685_9BACT|nr:MAG: UDP-glucose 4-epimerase GalE [bacterium (Candidatus Blackallbacteria) CG18_big_fil_WC_8_21_14_2_50_49_26]PIW17557.1 MAG: UDP-glucose 4-epimerase GalE [bacterium (Candidatus Blackallbacteria) CG17_big_fil_post_rev_8_21_14_2_50_48_46]PIW48412.1 MAG: UDP-glucose 4-epimerase GalE [bacterium (Candidatus Blackallbacteria) CG13_big_fil_rev_8_21_14_2_50_49_14]
MTGIAVMGGAGYIGSHVVKYLQKQGLAPLIYDNLSGGHAPLNPNSPFIEGDIGDSEKLSYVFKKYAISAVMNFAGLIAVGESVSSPDRYYQNNVLKTLSLLDSVISAGIQNFIFSSTCAIYGTPQFLPLTEAHPFLPLSPYGRTKLAIEMALADYAHAFQNFNYVSLRYFNAAGADPEGELGECHEPETHLIPIIFEAISGKREQVFIHGTDYDTHDGTCIRDYIHVWDLAQAHLRALKFLREKKTSACFNLGNGHGFSVKEVIASIEKVTGREVPLVEGPPREGDPPVLVGSSEKAMQILGWKPQFSRLEDILSTAWLWHKKNNGQSTLPLKEKG